MGELTVEIRWWGKGGAPRDVVQWFAEGDCVASESGERSDLYLPITNHAIGIKYRGGGDVLEIKSRVCEARLEIDGLPQAELWIKQSLPLAIDRPMIVIAKRRAPRMFDCTEGPPREIALDADELPKMGERPSQGCTVERARVTREGADWWSVCFEAFGDLDRVATSLSRAIERLSPLPASLIPARSASYPAWLADPELRDPELPNPELN